MKKLITLLTLLLAYSVLLYMKNTKEPSFTQVISLLKYHYVVEHEKTKISVPIFISNQHHEILKSELVDRVILKNDEIKMDVEILDIQYQHQENFNDINYDLYQYEIELPIIEYAFLMEHTKMHLILDNTLEYEIDIGSIEFFLNSQTFDSNWDSIDAKRYESILSVEYLNIKTEYNIDAYVSPFTLTYYEDNEYYKKLFILNKSILYWDIPIILQHENFKEMIMGIHWISSKRILTQTEDYHVTYIWYGSQSRETF